MSLLKIIAIGNLGNDPELKYSQDGKPICTFSMACSEKKKDRKTGDMLETTTWLRLSYFGRQAEIASQYLAKGKPVYIEGKGRLETWTDRDGKTRTTLEVFGTDIQFIAQRENRDTAPPQRQQKPAPQPPANAATLSMTDDDVPF